MSSLADNRNHNSALSTMLVVATIAHLFIIMGVGFDLPRSSPPASQRSLDVILIPPRNKTEEPKQADFLAPKSQEGGTKKLGHARPKAVPTQPALKKSRKASAERIRSGVPAPDKRHRQKVITSKRNPEHKAVIEEKPPIEAPSKPSITELLSSTREEIARLTAELDRNSEYASRRVRRKVINASTQEYKYAAYLESWRRKIERVGNLNYPDEAKRKKLYGDLLLHVAVRADGSVKEIRVLRSSGHKILDDAAVRIVRLAAPFSPFPEEIRKEVDLLDITRTWQFLSSNRLFSAK